ncbi:site-specific DNA-methyltransferase [Pseudomonas sp. WS 5011]|uniref:site-specific DNA-methyltransferase n=1 Tax=Pseudomonas sp. WS 5011 TaxID=2717477 RepID=UPI001475A90D|nr:site-specific DNA-methyltransferase [Pseudomonas sp. WS 5011]NMY52630.1 site-specific DNA-methyltransferase [Pseudomonas sp. WS 5011]
MPELHFKGKEFVFNHHLGVPYRPLQPDANKSVGGAALDGNLIIQGDNLHALKALMPFYAGQVDCIFIDPPYNTGNEKWSYNDNVNSPILKDWLTTNPVDKEDMLRHDKWCCLMYPRLKLLHELLAEDGSFWMTLDDNEIHRARMLMDEIFGEGAFVASIVWQARYSVSSDASVSNSHNHILVYSKAPETWKKLRNEIERDEKQARQYSNLDKDPEGPWRAIPWDAPEERENLCYPIKTPKGSLKYPPKGRHWSREESQWLELVEKGLAYFGKNEDGAPSYKRYLKHAETVVPTTWWPHDNSGHTDEASKELAAFNLEEQFATPKPVRLLEKILQIATRPDSLVLDSFAGSGTTAHAILRLNKRDSGNRRFILVECESYADRLTAERVRRVIGGYAFEGTTKEQLLSTKISFTSLKKADKLLAQIQGIENLEGHRFDKITKKIENDTLTVVGEKKVTEKVEGLGGSFTYCTLGEPLDLDKLLTGEALPDYLSLGSWLFHTATMAALEPAKVNEVEWYLGESSQYHVWLVYRPELEFLKSRDAALTLNLAQKIAAAKSGKKHLVFAAAKFVPNKDLLPMGVEFSPLPFALYRVEK